ncbi:MAG: hypothetical protein K0S53_3239 [Bacteroidetes bacterium]|jgi:hypothetical protein|nr:hypothetical protein [Bacteroidota bacterium]MDF2452494.1 hypothetical protein [Bacteroidota bacterium]
MKLFYISALIVIALSSCKKDRTCTCETTKIASSGVTAGVGYVDSGPFGTTTDINTMPKVTKKEARANCVSGENTSTYTDGYGDTKTETIRKDCVLK